jgi:uncharacterized protein (TIGR00661 family)
MDHPFTEKYHSSRQKPRILVAPLDWGLGHATRCIPIIKALVSLECDVWLAGNGPQKKLLQLEFPALPFLEIEGYKVRYAKSITGMIFMIAGQTRKIFNAIHKEHAWLENAVKDHQFDAVISDNRYGLYNDSIACIFITHQLKIKTPFWKWSERILQQRNYKYVNRFTECWVPDTQGKNNLAGDLSHPKELPVIPVKYLGLLSRFVEKNINPVKDHLVVIISGPEPQRSLFENKIVKDIGNYPGTAAIIRGLPESQSIIPSTGMLRFYNHLGSDQLNDEIAKADLIICRSGYSTVMDIARLNKRAIMIPTPGQTEQEYLAAFLSERKLVCAVTQKNFSLANAIRNSLAFPYQSFPSSNEELLNTVIADFVDRLRKG